MLTILTFACAAQAAAPSCRLLHIAADPLSLPGISQVLPTQQVQNAHCSLPERTVPPSLRLAEPETGSHCWPTHLSLTTVSSWSSYCLYLLNTSLTVAVSLHGHPRLSPDHSSSMTHQPASTWCLHTPFYTAGRVLFEDRFIHSFIGRKWIQALLYASCDQGRQCLTSWDSISSAQRGSKTMTAALRSFLRKVLLSPARARAHTHTHTRTHPLWWAICHSWGLRKQWAEFETEWRRGGGHCWAQPGPGRRRLERGGVQMVAAPTKAPPFPRTYDGVRKAKGGTLDFA